MMLGSDAPSTHLARCFSHRRPCRTQSARQGSSMSPRASRGFRVLRALSFQDKSDRFKECKLSASQDKGNHEDNTKGQTTSSSLPNSPDRNTSHPHLPTPQTNTKSKLETYKVQKKNYRSQKKEAAKELLSTITDPSVVLLGDWLKVRGTLKSWTKLWCVLKPGVLILYKSDKQKRSHWVGTILLNTCQLLERPSKKDGFCFKLFHPLDQSIWATKGPNGETIGAFVQPLPYSYCIFRAPSESAGKCWMDALELALKCTNLLKRSMTRSETCTPETNSDVTIPIGFGSKVITEIKYTSAT